MHSKTQVITTESLLPRPVGRGGYWGVTPQKKCKGEGKEGKKRKGREGKEDQGRTERATPKSKSCIQACFCQQTCNWRRVIHVSEGQ